MSHPHRRHPVPPVPPQGSERGVSLSAFVATIVVALLAMGGLVIDGGAQSTASRECQQVATEAARAASDAGAVARAAGGVPDAAAMLAAGQARISTTADLSGTVTINEGKIVVTTAKRVPTTFLSLIGIGELRASGAATADLFGTG